MAETRRKFEQDFKEGYLADHGLDPTVDRADDQHVAAGVATAQMPMRSASTSGSVLAYMTAWR